MIILTKVFHPRNFGNRPFDYPKLPKKVVFCSDCSAQAVYEERDGYEGSHIQIFRHFTTWDSLIFELKMSSKELIGNRDCEDFDAEFSKEMAEFAELCNHTSSGLLKVSMDQIQLNGIAKANASDSDLFNMKAFSSEGKMYLTGASPAAIILLDIWFPNAKWPIDEDGCPYCDTGIGFSNKEIEWDEESSCLSPMNQA